MIATVSTATRTRRAAAAFASVLTLFVAGCASGPAGAAAPASAPSSTNTTGDASQSGRTSSTIISGDAGESASGSAVSTTSSAERTMTNSETQADRDAITANFRARQQAMINGDTAELRTLSTPDSHAGHITGYDQPREEWFDQIESGYFDYHAIDNHSIDVILTGRDTATLVARSTIDVTIGGSRGTWHLESTASYVRQDGRWLAGDGTTRMY